MPFDPIVMVSRSFTRKTKPTLAVALGSRPKYQRFPNRNAGSFNSRLARVRSLLAETSTERCACVAMVLGPFAWDEAVGSVVGIAILAVSTRFSDPVAEMHKVLHAAIKTILDTLPICDSVAWNIESRLECCGGSLKIL